jgi:hypothetical protein
VPERCLRSLHPDGPPGHSPIAIAQSDHVCLRSAHEALGLASIDGLAWSEGLADSPADGATVGIGASVGVGVDDGPHAIAETARPMMRIARLSTVIPPCRAFNGSASIVTVAVLPARASPR